MLFLLFQLGDDRYALDASQVVEILPLVEHAERCSGRRRALPGTLNYRGAFVPVIDLSELVLGRPAPPRLSTRIILVRCSGGEAQPNLLGPDRRERDRDDAVRARGLRLRSGIVSDGAPYLGPIASGPRGSGSAHRDRQAAPASLRDLLLKQPAEADDARASSKSS